MRKETSTLLKNAKVSQEHADQFKKTKLRADKVLRDIGKMEMTDQERKVFNKLRGINQEAATAMVKGDMSLLNKLPDMITKLMGNGFTRNG